LNAGAEIKDDPLNLMRVMPTQGDHPCFFVNL